MNAYLIECQTLMAEAIRDFFVLLDQDLAAKGAATGSVKAVIFGGAAVHMYTSHRPSSDVDAEFLIQDSNFAHSEVVFLAESLPPIDYVDEHNQDRFIEYDPSFKTVFAPLHHDFEERLLFLWEMPEQVVTVYLPSREDLAISKLGRFGQVDIDDIVALLSHHNADIAQFESLGEEACRECAAGRLEVLLTNLQIAIKMVNSSRIALSLMES